MTSKPGSRYRSCVLVSWKNAALFCNLVCGLIVILALDIFCFPFACVHVCMGIVYVRAHEHLGQHGYTCVQNKVGVLGALREVVSLSLMRSLAAWFLVGN